MPAEREILETLCPNYEILVVRACFQVSFTVFSFYFLLEVDFKLWQVCSHVLKIFTCHGAETLLIYLVYSSIDCVETQTENSLFTILF